MIGIVIVFIVSIVIIAVLIIHLNNKHSAGLEFPEMGGVSKMGWGWGGCVSEIGGLNPSTNYVSKFNPFWGTERDQRPEMG